MGLHVLLEFILMPEAPFAPFAFEREVLGVDRQDVATKRERVRDFEVAVPALMDLLALVCL